MNRLVDAVKTLDFITNVISNHLKVLSGGMSYPSTCKRSVSLLYREYNEWEERVESTSVTQFLSLDMK